MNYLNEIKSQLKKLKPELSEKFYVSEIGIFGSITRDDFRADSDIDILVDFKKPIGIEFIDLADYLEEKIKRKIDLISKNGLKPHFFSTIESTIHYV